MIRVSGSALPRVEVCPGSAVLPHVGSESVAADAGSAGHEHVRDRSELGVDDAVSKIDQRAAEWGLDETETGFLRSRMMKWEWSPPVGSICEVRLALWPDWTVTRVPEDQRFVEGALLTGAFDVAWCEKGGQPARFVADDAPIDEREQVIGKRASAGLRVPEGAILWVLDVKTGQDRYVATIETNFQVHLYAWMAAVYFRAARVMPAICFPGPGEGDWDVPARPWGARELAATEARLRALWTVLEQQQARLGAGEPLSLTEGPHCDYCPAQSRCPAKTALLKSVLSDGGTVPFGDAPLTLEQAAKLAGMMGFFDVAKKRARRMLEVYVGEHGPIPLGDGRVFGPEPTEVTEILAEPARAVLAAELGEFADQAIGVDITGASIERAVKAKLASEGKDRGVAPARARIFAKLGEAGALSKKTRPEWKVHRPKAALPPVEDLISGGPVLPAPKPVAPSVAVAKPPARAAGKAKTLKEQLEESLRNAENAR